MWNLTNAQQPEIPLFDLSVLQSPTKRVYILECRHRQELALTLMRLKRNPPTGAVTARGLILFVRKKHHDVKWAPGEDTLSMLQTSNADLLLPVMMMDLEYMSMCRELTVFVQNRLEAKW
jgi:hypothetical protein